MVHNSKPMTAKVYDYVYAGIINGEITANDILSEARLSAQLQVSKAPVREALIALCEERILQVMPRMGYKVIQISPSQVAKLTEARLFLELYMLQKSFPTIGEVQVAQLRNLSERKQVCSENTQPVLEKWRNNIEFHMTLAGYSDNEYLLEALHRVLRTCARAATQCFLGNHEKSKKEYVDLHGLLMQALEDRDYEKAVDVLKMDIREIL